MEGWLWCCPHHQNICGDVVTTIVTIWIWWLWCCHCDQDSESAGLHPPSPITQCTLCVIASTAYTKLIFTFMNIVCTLSTQQRDIKCLVFAKSQCTHGVSSYAPSVHISVIRSPPSWKIGIIARDKLVILWIQITSRDVEDAKVTKRLY